MEVLTRRDVKETLLRTRSATSTDGTSLSSTWKNLRACVSADDIVSAVKG